MVTVKQWVAGAVLLGLVLLTAGWFLIVSPERGEAAELRELAVMQEQDNARLETALEVLRVKAEGLSGKRSELELASKRIPEDAALPELMRSLSATAAAADVELLTVTPTPPTALAATAPVAPAPVEPTAPGAAAAPVLPQPAAVTVSTLEVKVVVVGDFYAVEQFVALLEELPRALRLTALTLDPGPDALAADQAAAARAAEAGRTVRATVTARAFTTTAVPAAPPPPVDPAAPAASPAAQTAVAPAPDAPAAAASTATAPAPQSSVPAN